MRFEWDPGKARINRRNHGVSFEEACSVFYDPLAATGIDPDHSEGENRLITFGTSSRSQLVVVAHTEREEVIRVISARVATRSEKHLYEEG
jgi:uncharacterized DUF497 family protein